MSVAAGLPKSDERLVIARAWQRGNAILGEAFDHGLMVNPTWNMMLELYVAWCERRVVTVQRAMTTAGVAAGTAERYVQLLCSRGLAVRVGNQLRGGPEMLTLTADGVAAMEQALDGVTASNERLGIGHLRLVQ